MVAAHGAKGSKGAHGVIRTQGIDHVTLSVADLDRGIKFYTELLGLKLLRRFGDPRQAYLLCGRNLMALIEVKDYPGLLNISKSRAHLSLLVSKTEFQRALPFLQDNGVRVIYGPDRWKEGKRLILLDPDENKIALSYPKTKI